MLVVVVDVVVLPIPSTISVVLSSSFLFFYIFSSFSLPSVFPIFLSSCTCVSIHVIVSLPYFIYTSVPVSVHDSLMKATAGCRSD